MAKKKRTKYVPTFVHVCDDFVLTDGDGNEYYPHAGETVTFRTDLPWRIIMISADMPNDEYCPAVIRVLKRQIRDWDWTDDEGEPWPSPKDDPAGFDAAIWDISATEREYLRACCWEKAKLGEASASPS